MAKRKTKFRLQEYHRWLFLGIMVLILLVGYLYSSRKLDKLEPISLKLVTGAANQQFYADAQTIKRSLDEKENIDVTPTPSTGADLNAFALMVGPKSGYLLGFVQDGQTLDKDGVDEFRLSRKSMQELSDWGVDTSAKKQKQWNDYEKLGRQIKALVPLYEMPLYIFIKKAARKTVVDAMVQEELKENPRISKDDLARRAWNASLRFNLVDVLKHRDSLQGRWYFGATGTSTYALMDRIILPSYGTSLDDFPGEDSLSNYSEAQSQLSEGRYDVAFFLLPQRSPFLKDPNIQQKYDLVVISKADPLCYQHPELHPSSVQKGSFSGQDIYPGNDTPTVAVRIVLACSANLPDPIAYKIAAEMYASPACRAAFPAMKFADARIGEKITNVDDTGVPIYPFHNGAKLFLTDEPLTDVFPISVWTAAIPLVISAFGWMTLKLRKQRMRESAIEIMDKYHRSPQAVLVGQEINGYGAAKDFSLLGEEHLNEALEKVIRDQIQKEHYDVVKEVVRRFEARSRAIRVDTVHENEEPPAPPLEHSHPK